MIMIKKIGIGLIGFTLLCAGVILWGNDIAILFEDDLPSSSQGNVADGTLENGKRMPTSGSNFVTYSRLGFLIGRNGIHSKIRDVVLDSYDRLYRDYPESRFMIGECSWLSGGSMKPHRTHQNGTSVDFMVPVRNEDGKIDLLPSHLFNKFGYNVDFDSLGRSESLRIDFNAIGMHLFYLYASCKTHDVDIDLVIFDPQLQTHLFATTWGAKVKDLMRFTTQSVWIRHDEHYHINFKP